MVIYKITNTVNNKIYVGKTKNVTQRWKNHTSNVGKLRRPLYDAMLHYGIDKFVMEIIDIGTPDNIDELEKFWIKELNSINEGYNLTEGGGGGDTFSNRTIASKNKTRRKLSQAAKLNMKNPEYVKKLSDATKKLWANTDYVNRVRINYLKAVSSESYKENHSKKMKEALKSPQLRKKWSDVKLGKNNNRWLGYMYVTDTNGNVTCYETSKSAAKHLQVTANTLIQHAKNNTTFQRGKYVGWKFALSKINNKSVIVL